MTLLQECHADRLRAGFHLEPELEANVGRHLDPFLNWVGRLRLRRMRARCFAHEEHRHFVELEQLHALAVERHLELLAFGALAEHLPETELQQRQPDHVLAIDREVVLDGRAATGAEWLPFERLVLTQIALDRVGHLGWCRIAFSDRQPADLCCCRYIPFKQRRRDAEDVSDVVEAVTRVVGRKQCRGVDFQREQVADRVGVLDAVHAVKRRPPGVWSVGGEVIDRCLDGRGKSVEISPRRSLGASWWHETCAHLADDLLPCLGVGRHAISAHRVEHESTGLQCLVVTGDAGPASAMPAATGQPWTPAQSWAPAVAPELAARRRMPMPSPRTRSNSRRVSVSFRGH